MLERLLTKESASRERGSAVSSLFRDWPRWSRGEGLVFVLFVALALSYVVFLPSFEGPDESEHARYIQAWAKGGDVHPVDPQEPLRWGYQVHQPPLYYAIAGGLARLLEVTFHERLLINQGQNPRYPFLRHDSAGQRFPYDDVHRGLHVLRLLSVLFGVLTFLVLQHGFRLLFPDEPASRTFLLAASMLAPNTLQLFGTVANDGLNMLFCAALLVLAIAIVRDPRPRFFLVAGACAGLAAISKITGFAALAVAGSVWAIDGLVNRRFGTYLRGMLFFLPPMALLIGPYFAANLAMYGDPIREGLTQQLFPAFYLQNDTRPLSMIMHIIGDQLPSLFAADLGWQTIRLEGLGRLLFWPWLLGVGVSGVLAWRRRGDPRRIPAERLVPTIALLSSLILLVAANREWGNLQVRHVWCLYPFTLAGIVYTLALFPMELRVWGRAATATALAGVLLVNVQVLFLFQEFFEPGKKIERLNRDYDTYLYTHMKDRRRAQMYLRYGR